MHLIKYDLKAGTRKMSVEEERCGRVTFPNMDWGNARQRRGLLESANKYCVPLIRPLGPPVQPLTYQRNRCLATPKSSFFGGCRVCNGLRIHGQRFVCVMVPTPFTYLLGLRYLPPWPRHKLIDPSTLHVRLTHAK